MINLEVNWIKEKVFVTDDEKKTYGVISFHEIDLDRIERTDSLEEDYKSSVLNMIDNDEINIRDNETGEEVYV